MITAKQLAEKLLENPDDVVCMKSGNFELNGNIVPMGTITLSRFKGKIEEKPFRDAFDYTNYTADVVTMLGNSDEKIQFVNIIA